MVGKTESTSTKIPGLSIKSKELEYFKCLDNEFTNKAVNIIEDAQKLWDCGPNDEKYKTLQKIGKCFPEISLRQSSCFSLGLPVRPWVGFMKPLPLPVSCSLGNEIDVKKVPEICKDIISGFRRTRQDTGKITDSDIAAIYAIHWSLYILAEHDRIKHIGLKIEDNLPELENDLEFAETILGWANKEINELGETSADGGRQRKASEENIIPLSVPIGSKLSDVKAVYSGPGWGWQARLQKTAAIRCR
ncbi:MAG: hypothetical protein ACUZ8O_00780 [Candidatus Anammoxibacter sp.]